MAFDLGKWMRGPSQTERLTARGVRPDVVAVGTRMATDRNSDITLLELGRLLPADEKALVAMEGRCGKHLGLAVLTERRIVFLGHRFEGAFTGEVSLDDLLRVEQPRPSSLLVATADRELLIDRTLGTSAAQFAEAVTRQLQGTLPGRLPDGTERDPLEQLAELRALRDAGVMSADEFEAEKARLIAEL